MSIAVAKKLRKKPTKSDAGVSITLLADDHAVRVPSWVKDLASFRVWRDLEEVPEKLRAFFLDGEVWIDMSREQIYTHLRVKGEFNVVLGGLAKALRRGQFIPDGLYLVNEEANLSCNPDGTYFHLETLETGRLCLVEGKHGGYVEVAGTPDMVLEIVSDSSVSKDLHELRELYWKARIPEYWLVDVRTDEIVFEIYRHTARHYVASRKQEGWVRSNVLDKSFRLVRQQDKLGNPEFTLEIK